MERKLFGHRTKKKPGYSKLPGSPYNAMGSAYSEVEDEGNDYEGKEHVKYKNPGFSKHDIRYPEDEPHMRSSVSKREMHQVEDNYHMGVPDQTERTLPAKIKRARMKMDAPDQEEPARLRGNMVHNVGYEGVEDTSGEEQEGPNHMQEDKERRKKMIVAVTKRKMKKSKQD